ncbi:T9SS type A sorting domain-containing protein [Candidatus Poribacteria bacterium]|nr:T9SS type A sorting domain-containing protein [Candidatus Poribacteria bacterium]
MARWISAVLLFSVLTSAASGETEILSSNDDGIIFELDIHTLQFTNEGIPEYDGCGFISKPDGLKFPMTRVMIGVPPGANLAVSILDRSEERRRAPSTLREKLDRLKDLPRIFPEREVKIVTDGYIRSQRIAILELHPVRYDRITGSLLVYTRMTVRASFTRPYAAPPLHTSYVSEPRQFESLLKENLLNYGRARLWRRASSRKPSPAPSFGPGKRIKIYVEKTGVYRITGREFKEEWGIDLSGVDPRTFRLTCKGEELPIYVRGESDGRFDPDDYIEFLGVNPNYIYTRYNIYWLEFGTGRGIRVSAIDGEPINPVATYVTSFRSKIHFEEDHVHNVLNQIPPEEVSPDNPFEWFDKLDHWFWTGIKNGENKNEVRLHFKLFDVAKSFSRPKIAITLQGGTPTEHDILVQVNGIRIDRARFPKQEIVTLSRTLPANSLIDASKGDNVISCIKIDTTGEKNTIIYPYHVYINSFDVEYMRLYKAVHDALDFSSPEEREVDKGDLLEYSIEDFLADDVDLFIHDGTRLLTMITNPAVERVKLDENERERFKRILDVEGLKRAPDYAYTVKFQLKYTIPTRFYAVSSRGALKPALVQMREEEDLLSTSNSADYIIITHPLFMEAARRLADWRSTAQGGGFRVKVVDVTDIYDQFNYGIVHPKAIKDFLRYAYENWAPPKLTYVLILADATVDFHGVTKKLYPKPPELSGYIPTYFIWTQYGETSTDHWFATLSGSDALPDVYLSRIPVETVEQAEDGVDKIIRYERNRPNGEWRRRIISIADDATTNSGDFIFKQSMVEIDRYHIPPGYENVKLFLDDIREDLESHPEKYKSNFIGDVAKEMIVNAFDRGAVLAQYAGHAGRFVWAHEIIFDRFGVDMLAPNDKIPFMLVYSCYNGYFDGIGQDSMAELLLRKPDAGIIGMFSATRQTYGSANDSLSKITLDEIFKFGKRRIGRIAFDSKVELLLRNGLGELEVMMQYTLFGDPATKLALPDYRIEPRLERYSFNPGDVIVIMPGEITGDSEDNPSSFSGKLVARVRMKGEVIASSEVNVSGGRYPRFNVRLPRSIKPGEAILDLYASSADRLAVGGAKIKIGLPSIRDISAQIKGDKIRFTCSVYGPSSLGKVLLNWKFPQMDSFQSEEMVKEGDHLFSAEIDSPPPGERITYEIQAISSEGSSTSDRYSIEIPSPPDLSIITPAATSLPLIYLDGMRPTVEIQWDGREKPDQGIEVALFEGNPDQDRDGKPDPRAKEIGRVRIERTDWIKRDLNPSAQMKAFTKDPLNLNWMAKVSFKTELLPGERFLFVWIDPNGRIEESDEGNNVGGIILGSDTFKAPQGRGTLSDPRSRFSISLPGGATGGKPLTVKLSDSTPGEGQVGLERLPLSGGKKTMEIFCEEKRFSSHLNLRISFDFEELKRQIAGKMGMNYSEALLRQTIKELLQASSIYLWLEEVSGWRKVDSKVKLDVSGEVKLKSAVTLVSSENEGAGGLDNDRSWAENNAQEADWVLIFKPGNMRLIKLGERIEDMGTSTGYFQSAGLHLRVQDDPKSPFRAGDSISFSTSRSGSGEMRLSGVKTQNYGNGVARILSVNSNAPDDAWVLIFLDDERFVIVGAQKGLIRSGDGEPIVGRIGEEFSPGEVGLSLMVDSGSVPFRRGDTIRIVVGKVGVMEAEIDRPGTYAIMRSHDTTPPEISIAVSGQGFTDGDFVPGNPNFAISIRDNGGVDPESIKLNLVRNLIEKIDVKKEEVLINPSQSGVITVNYTPKLDPAKYELTVKCADLDGHPAEKRVEFVVSKNASLSDVMNYPNPFSDETEITCVLSSQVDRITFKIYTLSGRLIWERRMWGSPIGFVQVRWRGRDRDGREVANGVYYCKVTAEKGGKRFTKVIKLMRLR